MLFRAQSVVALLAAIAISQGTIFQPHVFGRQDNGLGALNSILDGSTDSSSSSTASSTSASSSSSSSSSSTSTTDSSSTTSSSSTTPSTTPSSSSTTPSSTNPPSSTSSNSPAQTSSSVPAQTTPNTTPSSTVDSNPTSSASSSSTSSAASPTKTGSLTDNGSSGSSGMSSKTKSTIIGVVVGVGGFIVLAGLGLVAYRIWGRKKVDEDNDGLMSYQMGSGAPEKTSSSAGGTSNNPFQSTLETYHNPARNVNASSNF